MTIRFWRCKKTPLISWFNFLSKKNAASNPLSKFDYYSKLCQKEYSFGAASRGKPSLLPGLSCRKCNFNAFLNFDHRHRLSYLHCNNLLLQFFFEGGREISPTKRLASRPPSALKWQFLTISSLFLRIILILRLWTQFSLLY